MRDSKLSPEVLRAEQLDSEGKHVEAITQLVAGVRNDDVEAVTRIGKRLLVGDRAPLLPSDGARFLEDAARRGGAEAAARLAVLHAVGAHAKGGIDSGLRILVEAAERGWPPAQQQIEVLATGGESAAENSPHSYWAHLAQRIDLKAWCTAPPAVDLSNDPLVRAFDGFVSPGVCKWLIERTDGRLTRALVYDALAKVTKEHSTRTNSAALFNLLDTDFVCTLVQTRMAVCLGVPLRHFEPITVLHYDQGEEITEHFDFVDPNVPDYAQEIARGQRVVTFLVYLNDDYAGGETEFPRLGLRHKGAHGQGLFFANAQPDGNSDTRTLHAGRPPMSGEKWIVSQFVRNRPMF